MDTNDVSISGPGCSAATAPEPGTATLLGIGLFLGFAGYLNASRRLSRQAA
jgi:hypothetical protein